MKIGLPDFRHLWVQFGAPKSAGLSILEVTKYHFPTQVRKFVYKVRPLYPPLERQWNKTIYSSQNCDLTQAIRGAYPTATNEEVATINKAVLEINTTCCDIKEEGIACTAYQRDLQNGPDDLIMAGPAGALRHFVDRRPVFVANTGFHDSTRRILRAFRV